MPIVRDPKIDTLGRLPLFAGCSVEQLAAVAAVAEHVHVERFTDLTREGDAHDGLVYVVVTGMVQVKRGHRVVAYLQDGDVVGELEVLDGTARVGTVTTVMDSELLLIDRRHLGPLLRDNPVLADRLDAIADRRRIA